MRKGTFSKASSLKARTALAAFACLLGTGAAQAATSITHGLVLMGATVVDTHDGKLSPDMAIVVEGSKIVQILPARSVMVGGTAQSVDAHGKFVVPGYLDMHAHVRGTPSEAASLKLMLANGITGYRQMAASDELLAERRKGIPALSDAAPEMLAMPGTILTAVNAATPEAAIAEVKKQKEEGADFIKMIDVPPPAFFAAAAESKRQGLPMVGHLPPRVNIWDASRIGMRSIEHLGPKEGIALGCSGDEDAIRKSLEENAPVMPPIVGAQAQKVMAMAISNPMVFTSPAEFDRFQREMATFDATKCRRLAATFVANQTWQVPTLIRVWQMEYGADSGNDTPNARYLPAAERALRAEVAQRFAARFTPAQQVILKQLFDYQLRLVKLFDEAGVPMMAGTDGKMVPGFGLHDEFDLLGRAGLSPLRVLQMTTLDGAQFLGREAVMGSVKVGKNADLVVLDANPIASVQNLHHIHGVVRAGHYYSEGDLAGMEKAVADHEAAFPGTMPMGE